MKLLKTFLVLATVAVPLAAGIRITMEETDLEHNTTTASDMLLEPTRMKIDYPDNAFIFLTEGGRRALLVDKKRNEYREIDQATVNKINQALAKMMKQMEDMMKNMPPQQRAMMERMMKGKMGALGSAMMQAVPPITWEDGGASTVNGVPCTMHTAMQEGAMVSQVCAGDPDVLAQDPATFQIFLELRAFMSELVKAVQNSPLTSMIPAGFGEQPFEGFPMLRRTFVAGAAVSLSEYKTSANEQFTDADFSPGNAKKVEMNLPEIPDIGN